MKFIPKDYKRSDEGGKDGKYVSDSFKYVSIDKATKTPIVVQSKNGVLQARIMYQSAGENVGPMSMQYWQIPMWATEVLKLPAEKFSNAPDVTNAAAVTSYLQAIEAEFNAGKTTVDVEVSSGWVDCPIKLPKATFQMKCYSIGPQKNNVPTPKEMGEYSQCYFNFEIINGAGSQATPYKGARFSHMFYYDIAEVDGQVDWKRTEVTQEYTKAAMVLSRFIEMIAPSIRDTKATPPNQYNLLPFFQQHILQSNVVFEAFHNLTSSGYDELTLDTVTIAGQAPVATMMADGPAPWETETTQVNVAKVERKPHLEQLGNALSLLAGKEEPAIKLEGEIYMLTSLGIEMAKKHLAPFKVENGGHLAVANINEFSADDVEKIFKVWEKSDIVSEDKKEQLLGAMLGLDVPKEEPKQAPETPW
jgi:hypothetical protein